MSSDRSHPSSKRHGSLGRILLIGFGTMLMLMAFSWYVYIKQLDVMHDSASTTKLASEKMEAIAKLIEIARTRTRLASQMALTEDIFERDEVNLMLDREAANFIRTRDWLLQSGLDKKEQAIMDQIAEFTTPTLDLQRKTSTMAMQDDPALLIEAQKMVMFEVLPMQGKIIDKFMELFRLQKTKIEQSVHQVEQDYEKALKLASVIISGSILLAILVAFYIVRKSTLLERALQTEKDKASTTLKSIGDAVISTDSHGRIEYMNPVAEQLTGFTLAEPSIDTWAKFFWRTMRSMTVLSACMFRHSPRGGPSCRYLTTSACTARTTKNVGST